MKIKELFKDEKNWTRETYARDKSGEAVRPRSDEAACWCLTGALYKCYGDAPEERREARNKLMGAFPSLTQNYVVWNDAPERTHAEVLALVEKLDI